MADDIEFTSIRDTFTPLRSGEMRREKVYVFYIGKHGPFTERVPLEGFDATEIDRRVMALRTHLATLPR